MGYVPPSGWVEKMLSNDSEPQRLTSARFHSRRDCPRVTDAGALREVDKPYSAIRCTHCASDVAAVPART